MAAVRLALFLSDTITVPLITPSTAATAATPVTPKPAPLPGIVATKVDPAVVATVPNVPAAIGAAVAPAVVAVNVTALLATALVDHPTNLPE